MHDSLNDAIRVIGADGVIRTLLPFDCALGQMTMGSDGRLLVAAYGCRRVYAVALDGSRTVVAGSGSSKHVASDEGKVAKRAGIPRPVGIASTADGTIYFSDLDDAEENEQTRIRKILPDGTLHTLRLPREVLPLALAPAAGGGLLVTDLQGVVWHVDSNGRSKLVAGTRGWFLDGADGDGGPAVGAQFRYPVAVAPTQDGGFLVADFDDHRIRRVDAAGTITTLAGTGGNGYSGDGGPATRARLSGPAGMAIRDDGGLLISDAGNDRLRLVAPGGEISTVAGSGIPPRGLADPMAMPDVQDFCSDAGCGATPAWEGYCGDEGCGPPDYFRDWNYFQVQDPALVENPGMPVTLKLLSSRAGNARVDVTLRGRRISRVKAAFGAGVTTLALPGLTPGRYVIRATGRVGKLVLGTRAKLVVK